ncbi:MAG: NADH-quinone oxidoreductase subunit L [Fidelibacterota bacterium]
MNIFLKYALVVYFLPLAAFIIQTFFGRKLPRKGDWVSISAILLAFALSIAMFAGMLLNYDPEFQVHGSFNWMDLGHFRIQLGFLIDNMTVIMMLVVTLISSMSHIYSLKYMEGDPGYSRYYSYLSLFTFSMMGIVLADNLMLLYVSWELVGLSSYLLIGFWYEKDSAANAGKKAFLTNRVGDIGFFIGIMLFFTAIGSFNYLDIFAGVQSGIISGTVLTLAGIGLFMGAVGKSAQVPLHIWLPDAMEGPTPVSALIHAATMVAAGVYMMVRLFGILSPDALVLVAYIGGITALFASLIAITRTDIKQVLAYSTVSQLGYMILAVGTGAYVAGFFHLVTHAMFKANLFYGAGSVIHGMHHSLDKLGDHDTDPQDMRNMGGLKRKMPVTYWSMMIGSLAISGVPLFSGFLSKDAILAGTLAFSLEHPGHILLPVFGFSAALLTAFYMFRMIFLTFHNEPQRQDIHAHIHESPAAMKLPLVLLSVFSLFIVFTLPSLNPFHGEGWLPTLVEYHNSFIPGGQSAEGVVEALHHAHGTAMTLSLIVAALGIGFAFLVYYKHTVSAEKLATVTGPFYRLSREKFFIDELYARLLYRPFLRLADRIAYLDWDLYDKYFINGFGHVTTFLSNIVGKVDYDGLDQTLVDGVGRSANWFGRRLRTVQTGRVQHYVLFALTAIIMLMIWKAI